MPINELEQHPCLDYTKDPNVEYKGIIIGTFPVYGSTDTLDDNLNIIHQRCNLDSVIMKFFYGSKRSYLWKYLFLSHGEEEGVLPANNVQEAEYNKNNAINFLNRNGLLITDVLKRVNRKEFSASDNDLWITNGEGQLVADNLRLNHSIIDLLESNLSVKALFFTASGTILKSPFGWFINILQEKNIPYEILINNQNVIGNQLFSMEININSRLFKAFFLPTPKPRGIHLSPNQQNLMFLNYIGYLDIQFYNQIVNQGFNLNQNQKDHLKDLRADFLIEIYKQALVMQNHNYDGSNPLGI